MNREYHCRVIVAHDATYTDPISVEASERLLVSDQFDVWDDNPNWIWFWCTNRQEKSGWVPSSLIEIEADGKGRALSAYDAIELTVAAGDELVVSQEESGWLWCTNQQGKSGWVPLEKVTWIP